jgi:F-type H+-transporting ATPase subunit delta
VNSSIARRYAKALFELAREEKNVDPVRSGLERLAEGLARHEDLSQASLNPMFSREEHLGVLKGVLGRHKTPDLVVRFVELLVLKNRVVYLQDIVRHFAELVDRSQGKETVRVRTPRRMSESEEGALRSSLEESLGRKVTLQFQEDPSLIAGIAVQISSRVFDGTVRGKLGEMRKALLQKTAGTLRASS